MIHFFLTDRSGPEDPDCILPLCLTSRKPAGAPSVRGQGRSEPGDAVDGDLRSQRHSGSVGGTAVCNKRALQEQRLRKGVAQAGAEKVRERSQTLELWLTVRSRPVLAPGALWGAEALLRACGIAGVCRIPSGGARKGSVVLRKLFCALELKRSKCSEASECARACLLPLRPDEVGGRGFPWAGSAHSARVPLVTEPVPNSAFDSDSPSVRGLNGTVRWGKGVIPGCDHER